MGIVILNQILMVLFVLAILVVLRHVINIVVLYMDDSTENKYVIGKAALVYLGLAIAYIITGIINGISL
jgi:hypothetical protein